MNFSEKLTKLRKQNNLSQEALADKLDVSRQSVSKWESGINYPEMDKLLSMCKIFNITLEELTNDNIDINNIKSKDKNYFDSLVNEITYIIDKTYYMFKNSSKRKRFKVLFELIILFFILLIFKIPFNYIINLGDKVFFSIQSNAGYLLSNIWAFFINIVYLALFIITYLYIYKSYYLDKIEYIEETNGKDEKTETKEVIKEVTIVKKESNAGSTIFNSISKIVSFCIKVFLIFFIIPFIILFIMAVIGLFVLISFLFKGVTYFGLILCALGGILLLGMFIDLIVSFLFNKRPNVHILLIILISSLSVIGVGIGLSILEISNTEFIDEAPIINSKKETLTYEYDINDNLLISPYILGMGKTIEDDTLGDKIIIEINYYKDIYDIYINSYETGSDNTYKRIEFYYNNHYSKILFDTFLNDLKNKKIHDYTKLEDDMITVKASKIALEKLDKISEEYANEIHNDTYNYYNNRILKLENEKELLNKKVEELTEENENLTDELQGYKNRIKELAE